LPNPAGAETSTSRGRADGQNENCSVSLGRGTSARRCEGPVLPDQPQRCA
jgi:hypothetical protein